MKISVPEPCSEKWSSMTPTEQGAFCQKCALEIIDFTDKSSLEIKNILTEKMQSKERVCGHIENHQLIAFNDEFIPWKSDRESFRAIWAFSLVAVFGFTLFSCQSTFSKEVVDQMNTTTEQLLKEEKDTLDIAKLNDSIQQLNNRDSLLSTTTDPWEMINIDTIMEWLEFETNKPFTPEICTIWLGDIGWIGTIRVEPYEEDPTQPTFATLTSPQTPPIPQPNSRSPFVNDPNQTPSQRLNAKHEKGRPEFEAHISPIPIDQSSRLYVTMPEGGSLRLSIWELSRLENIYFEDLDLVFGNHAIDINFLDFPVAKYAIQLSWEDEKVVIPFEILPLQKVS